MLPEYDFSHAKKNPYAKALKKQITINIDSNTIDYFKAQSETVGIPYQTLIIFVCSIWFFPCPHLCQFFSFMDFTI